MNAFRRLPAPVVAGFVVLLSAAAARADVIQLKNGGKLEGIVTQTPEGYSLQTETGMFKIAADKVAGVAKGPCALSEYLEKLKTLDTKNADAHYLMARWCEDHKLKDRAKEHFQKAIEANPDHEQARTALGFEKFEGKWMTHDEALTAQGLVKVDGEWVTQDQAKAIELEKIRRKHKRSIQEKLQSCVMMMASSDRKKRQKGFDAFIEFAIQENIPDAEKTAGQIKSVYDEAYAAVEAQTNVVKGNIIAANSNVTAIRTLSIFQVDFNGDGVIGAGEAVLIQLPQVSLQKAAAGFAAPGNPQ